MGRRGTWIVIGVAVVACGALAFLWIGAERRVRDAVRWSRAVLDSVSTDVALPQPPLGLSRSDTLYWTWTAINLQVHVRRLQHQLLREREMARTALDEKEVLELRQRGLGDPSQALRDSLTARPDLVPWPGYAVDRSTIVVLPPPMVYAGVDDGMSLGHVLLRYEVAGDGRIVWERVWSSLETPR
jgi:hypothetical protein